MKAADLLKRAAAQGASDVHIVPNAAPLFRIHGELLSLPDVPELAAGHTQTLILELLTNPQRQRLAQEFCVDFSVDLEGVRYRGNALFQRHGLEAVLRLVPEQIPSPEELMLPQSVTDLVNLHSGLVLVTGPTGSGKSTTMACLIDLINQRRRGNIITIEDPIEFVHGNKNCVVSQREIGIHALAFNSALRYVLRQDPNVVMIGEMRDLETIQAAVTVAETGHLVLATLHSREAGQAVDRMIDVFPGRQQQQIRAQLSNVLKAVIAQTLVPRLGGRGRIAVREIMIVNPAIGNLIRTGKTHEINSAIEMGAREGMISMTRALSELVKKGYIDPQEMQSRVLAGDSMQRRRSSDFAGPAAAA